MLIRFLVLSLLLAISQVALAVPPSVTQLLYQAEIGLAEHAKSVSGSGDDPADNALIYLIQGLGNPEALGQSGDSDAFVLLDAPTVLAAAKEMALDPIYWLEDMYPNVQHMGIIRAGSQEPLDTTSLQSSFDDTRIPSKIPEIEWLNLPEFWDSTGITGAGARVGILDSGLKSIVPTGFDAPSDPDYDQKYRAHPALSDLMHDDTIIHGDTVRSLSYREDSPELNNPFYGALRRNPDDVAKQYQIKGLRSAHGTQMSCALVGGVLEEGSVRPRSPAYEASLVFDFAGDIVAYIDPETGELASPVKALRTTIESLDWIAQQDIDLVNYSFGHGAHYRQAWTELEYDESAVLAPYSGIARIFDRAAYLNDFLLVKSAGNRSLANDPFAFTLTEPADAYNSLVVGNMNPYYEEGEDDNLMDYKTREQHFVRMASGRGPTLDGRRKPDIVAPGSHVMGCTIPFIDAHREDYVPMLEARTVSGTSIAAPLAGGLAALVGDALRSQREALWNISNMPPRYSLATKAVVINSAESRIPTAYEASPQTAALGIERSIFEDPNNTAWNNGYGFGYADAAAASRDIRNILQDSIELGEARYYQVRPDDTVTDVGPLKVTMAWEKRFPEDASHPDFDYGFPLTPMKLTLHAGDAVIASDDSVIDAAMVVHQVGRTVVDYSTHPTENVAYAAYNNVLQIRSNTTDIGDQACIAVRIMDEHAGQVEGQDRELFALVANYPLQAVDSCEL
ncbi:MAG: S8 family serine peptidase [Pseudomonadota bacterium]